MSNIEGRDFSIEQADGGFDKWESTEEIKYTFGVGPAGDLMVFRSKFHSTFAAELEKDVRWFVYAPGTWLTIKVLEEDELELRNATH